LRRLAEKIASSNTQIKPSNSAQAIGE